MKKIFLLICAAAALLVSCTKDLENRVGALEQDVQTLQQQITELTEKLNKDVDDLKKLIFFHRINPGSAHLGQLCHQHGRVTHRCTGFKDRHRLHEFKK